MERTDPTAVDLNCLPHQDQIEATLRAFLSGWSRGDRQRLADHLRRLPDVARPHAFRELLVADVEQRRLTGERPNASDYTHQFQEFDAIIQLVCGGNPPDTLPTETTSEHPQTIGPYRLIGRLGQGGMAAVYRATDPRLNRDVAVKLIHAATARHPETKARFHAEATALAKVEHPAIIRVYDIGEHNGQPYLATEYMPGGSLSRYLHTRAVPVREAVQLVLTVARGVDHAHACGIVHRDLKPANILLRQPNRTDEPVIADFGLARTLDQCDRLTVPGMVVGTPSYMAPEQAHGGEAGVRADVYSLGVILYECCVGRPPFAADTNLEMLRKVTEEPPRFPAGSPVPAAVQTVVLKCLEKSPKNRYPTAAALADDLERWLDGRTVWAKPASLIERLTKWVRRNPWPSTALATSVIGFLGVCLALSVAVRERREVETQAREVARQRDRAESEAYFSQITQARLEILTDNLAAAKDTLTRCAEERRGWEWQWLEGQLQGEVWSANGVVDSAVQALAYSPTGDRIAVGGGDPFFHSHPSTLPGILKLLDPAGRTVAHLVGHRRHVTAVAFTPDGRTVASVAADGRLIVWEAATGRLLAERTLTPEDTHVVGAVAVSPNGTRVAAAVPRAGRRAVVNVYTLPELTPVHAWTAETLDRIQFDPTGESLHVFGSDAQVEFRSDGTEQSRRVLGHLGTLSADGAQLATCAGANVYLHRGPNGPLRTVLSGHTGTVLDVAFSRDGLSVATAGADRTVRLWQSDTGRPLAVYRGHAGRVSRVAFHPTGHQLLSADETHGHVKAWDVTVPVDHYSVPAGSMVVHALAVSDDGRLDWTTELAHQSADVVTGRFLTRTAGMSLKPLRSPGQQGDATPDGRVFALSRRDRGVAVWTAEALADATLTRPARMIAPTTHNVNGVALSADGGRMVIGSRNPTTVSIAAWDTRTGSLSFERDFPGRADDPFSAVAITPGGEHVVWGVSDPASATSVLHVATYAGEPVGRYVLDRPFLAAIAVRPTDGRLAVVTESKLYVLSMTTGEIDWTRELLSPVYELKWSPDGRLLAGTDRDRVIVWEASGRQVLDLTGAPPRAADWAFNPRVAWSPNGRWLAAVMHNGTIAVWGARATTPGPPALDAWYLALGQGAADRRLKSLAVGHFHQMSRMTTAQRWTLGRANIVLSRFAEAKADFEPTAPTSADPEEVLMWGCLCRLTGQPADFARAVERVVAPRVTSDPWHPRAMVHLLPLLAPGPLSPAAREVMAKSWAGPSLKEFWSNLGIGLYAVRTGDADAVAKLNAAFDRAVVYIDLRPVAWLALAIAHDQKGEPARATEYRAKVLAWLDERRKAGDLKDGTANAGWDPVAWLIFCVLAQEAGVPWA